ncbi:MAG: trp operon repressor [Verrucomicrobia bacterium]|nr:trp operon repressor [Verrucomicrobiota bacterium]
MKKKTSWEAFIRLMEQGAKQGDLEALFNLFFTLEEKEMLMARLQIIQALLEGKKTQRTIAKDLGVSISQITRGSNALKSVSQAFLKSFRWR